jgi:hypothetical protein
VFIPLQFQVILIVSSRDIEIPRTKIKAESAWRGRSLTPLQLPKHRQSQENRLAGVSGTPQFTTLDAEI